MLYRGLEKWGEIYVLHAAARFRFPQEAHSTRNSVRSLIGRAQSKTDDRALLPIFANSERECWRARLTAPESARAMNANARDAVQIHRAGDWQASRERRREETAAHRNAYNLTDRELHVFALSGAGFGTNRIAKELGISPRTVETYHEHIKVKLGYADAHALHQGAREWLDLIHDK